MLNKKVVVITGSSSGIGNATANFLSEQGYIVYGISRRKSEGNFFSFEGDVTDINRIKEIFNEIFLKEGRIDYLINNAGMGISGAIEHTENEDIDKIFNVNLLAPIKISREVIPFMKKNNFGRIINICSVASVIALPFQACYSASKSALLSFSLALHNEIKDFNIKVSSVLPGDTKTNFTQDRVKNKVLESDDYGKRIKNSIEKMEKDEQNGASAIKVTKVIHKVMKKKNPPLTKTVGFGYKTIVFLSKILPTRLITKIVKKIYG